jgi:maltose alpha-D-glucosyltransferase/alpha-amylase
MDLVLNHTSSEHSWFKLAQLDSLSVTRNWYLWSKTKPKDWDKGMGFPKLKRKPGDMIQLPNNIFFTVSIIFSLI